MDVDACELGKESIGLWILDPSLHQECDPVSPPKSTVRVQYFGNNLVSSGQLKLSASMPMTLVCVTGGDPNNAPNSPPPNHGLLVGLVHGIVHNRSVRGLHGLFMDWFGF